MFRRFMYIFLRMKSVGECSVRKGFQKKLEFLLRYKYGIIENRFIQMQPSGLPDAILIENIERLKKVSNDYYMEMVWNCWKVGLTDSSQLSITDNLLRIKHSITNNHQCMRDFSTPNSFFLSNGKNNMQSFHFQ